MAKPKIYYSVLHDWDIDLPFYKNYLDIGRIWKSRESLYYDIPVPNHHIALATTADGRLVGCHIVSKRWSPYWASCGTYVNRNFRGQGIAQQLWSLNLDVHKIKTIKVETVTNHGFTLVKSLQETFPKVKIIHNSESSRKGKDLRKKK